MTSLHEQNGNLNIWWFPKEFCQSMFGDYQESGTNSCTLISLIMADKVSKEAADVGDFQRSVTELPQRAIDIFGTAINEGNAVYNRAISNSRNKNLGNEGTKGRSGSSFIGGLVVGSSASRNSLHSSMSTSNHLLATVSPMDGAIAPSSSEMNLNIPDALSALKDQPALAFQLHEWFFTHLHAEPTHIAYRRIVGIRLSQIFEIGLQLFQEQTIKLPEESTRFLFAAVIADSRTVIFIFEIPTHVVAIFDSHQHGHNAGALIAQAAFTDIHELAFWFINMINDVYNSQPDLFEVSFLTTNDSLELPQLLKVPN